jgi:hypothetical protein
VRDDRPDVHASRPHAAVELESEHLDGVLGLRRPLLCVGTLALQVVEVERHHLGQTSAHALFDEMARLRSTLRRAAGAVVDRAGGGSCR